MVNNIVYLSLGSNLGNREQNLQIALKKIAKFAQIFRKSTIYETEPVEYKKQPLFLNMVIAIKTSSSPVKLITKLQEIEQNMGRIKKNLKGPRLIDIDILYYNNKIINQPDLEIPHHAITKRNFVLTPLKEIAPRFIDPKYHQTITKLHHNLKKPEKITLWI